MKRFLARKAELEKETASQTPTLVPQNESANIQIAEELPKKTVTVISEAEEKKKNEKKVIRFGKKKVLATAALVAVIAEMLGGTAIGKKSYFLKVRRNETTISLDNDKNMPSNSKLEQAYEALESELGLPVLKLGYIPKELQFIKSDRNEEGIIFNKWINKDIEYYINDLEDNNQECECFITINNSYYYLFGYIEKEEFEKILEYLNFF